MDVALRLQQSEDGSFCGAHKALAQTDYPATSNFPPWVSNRRSGAARLKRCPYRASSVFGQPATFVSPTSNAATCTRPEPAPSEVEGSARPRGHSRHGYVA